MKNTHFYTVFDTVTVDPGGTSWSTAIPLWGQFTSHSLRGQITGDGTVKVEFYVKTDDIETKEGTAFSGYTKVSGEVADGKISKSLSFRGGNTVRFKATETGGTNSVIMNFDFWQGGGVRS